MEVEVERLKEFCNAITTSMGLPEEDAKIVSDQLVLAERLGHSSHGVVRLIYYYRALKDGYLNPKPEIRILRESSSSVLLDGDRGFGQVVATKATELAIRKSMDSGIGFGNAINLGHVGMLSYYILKVIENKMCGVAIANAPAVMAPLGGRKPFLGTNPVAIGIPFKEPIIFDGAMSVASRGKILIAMQKGESIPENWALDEEGKPTTDPSRAIKGILLPDGVKGYAFALFIDLFCGALLGGKFGYELPSNFALQGGFSVLVINPQFFRDYSQFVTSVEEYVAKLKFGETDVMLPFERELSRLRRASTTVNLEPNIVLQLNDLARELGCSIRL